MEEKGLEIYRQHRTHQKKYTYFLLAAAASAIALSVNLTKNASLSYSQIPLGLAVISWGLSFYYGCQYLKCVGAALYANFNLMKVAKGEHEDLRSYQEIEPATEGIKEAIESHSEQASDYASLQFSRLIAGAILFLIWHVVRMYLRS